MSAAAPDEPAAAGRPWFGRRPEPDAACPACGTGGATAFYAVDAIPVHSCLLMATREEAVDYPRRDLRLARCAACGFVFNVLFDASVHEYSPRYEETQGCSPTFWAFADDLARRLVDRYRLRGRRVLEIGCGKGEFLLQLCRAGDCEGIGIDPSWTPGRLPLQTGDRLEFRQEPYGPEHAALAADFIACRHTLEHVGPVRELLATAVRSLDGRQDVDVWIEVPDVGRVLEEGAFWDVYYEHCSYFTPGSLARLYRRVGLAPGELGLEFDRQYVVIGGRLASDDDPPPARAVEEPVAASAAMVERFLVAGPAAVDRWRRTLADAAAGGGRTVVWGAGSKGVAFLTTLGGRAADDVVAAVDVNPRKQGRFLPGTGHPVLGPADLPALDPTHVIVMNPVYVPEIRRTLAGLGLHPAVLPVHAAAPAAGPAPPSAPEPAPTPSVASASAPPPAVVPGTGRSPTA